MLLMFQKKTEVTPISDNLMQFRQLLILLIACVLSAYGQQLSANLTGDTPMIAQCAQVGITFGGGSPSYSFAVWSYDDQQYVSQSWTDTPGNAVWTIKQPANSLLYLYITDTTGDYSKFQRTDQPTSGGGSTSGGVGTTSSFNSTGVPQPPSAPTAPSGGLPPAIPIALNDCGSTAKCSFIATSTVAGTYPQQTLIGTAFDNYRCKETTCFPQPSATPTAPIGGLPPAAPTALNDCGSTAQCSFTATSTAAGTYPQQTLIGAAFDNCNSNETVTQTFTGSVTITNNWSVRVSASFGLPKLIDVSTSVTIGKEQEVIMSQTYTYNTPPQVQAALVGSADFNAIFGNMDVNYPSGPVNVPDAVYFQYDGQPPTVSLQTIGCGDSWPIWNTTSPSSDNAAGIVRRNQWCELYAVGLVALLGLVVF
ncbi:hypothetical protein K438DRAFT_2019661 [Mycena galopus ATCC 62051]|nr:hypothetical protein K438DRAFT_2019661 [Mycena galopus ATCC 62051]